MCLFLLHTEFYFKSDFCPFYKSSSLKNFKDYTSHVFTHLKNRFSKMINIIDIGQELHNLQDLITKNNLKKI